MGLQDTLRKLESFRVKKGDPPSVAARSELMNALIDTCFSLARGENMGKSFGIRKRVGQGSFTLMADIPLRGGGGGSTSFPWEVTADSFSGNNVLKVGLGFVGNTIPTIGSIPLDSTSTTNPPVIYLHGSDFDIWLKATVTLTSASSIAWHPIISAAPDAPTIIDFAPPNPPGETTPIDFRMIFDPAPPTTPTKGTFYVKIARILITPGVGGSPNSVKDIIQYLDYHLRSLALVGNDIVAF